MSINGQEHRNDDKEHGGGISPDRPTFNLIPNIRNQRRPVAGFNDTSDEEDDLGEYANLCGRQRGGRQWQPNYKGDDEYKLKVDIPNFSCDFNIEGLLEWLTEVDRFFDYTELLDDRKVKFVAYRLKGGASIWWDRLREMRIREGRGPIQT